MGKTPHSRLLKLLEKLFATFLQEYLFAIILVYFSNHPSFLYFDYGETVFEMARSVNAYGNFRHDLHEDLNELIEDLSYQVGEITQMIRDHATPTDEHYEQADRTLRICKRLMQPEQYSPDTGSIITTLDDTASSRLDLAMSSELVVKTASVKSVRQDSGDGDLQSLRRLQFVAP